MGGSLVSPDGVMPAIEQTVAHHRGGHDLVGKPPEKSPVSQMSIPQLDRGAIFVESHPTAPLALPTSQPSSGHSGRMCGTICLIEPQPSNPWASLGHTPPYIAAIDLPILDREHQHRYGLRCDVLPHAWLGDPRSARAVLLQLNPGFSERDVRDEARMPNYRTTVLSNLRLEESTSFWALAPGLEDTAAAHWWRPKLSRLAQSLGPPGWRLIHKELAVVEYFPYHSLRYRRPPRLPSQDFGFNLVREGLERGALFVVMRQWESWRAAVPDLIDHPRVFLNPHPRQAAISEANLGAEIFGRLVAALSTPMADGGRTEYNELRSSAPHVR